MSACVHYPGPRWLAGGKSRKVWSRALLAAMLCAVLSACAMHRPAALHAEDAPFATWRTFDWVPADIAPAADVADGRIDAYIKAALRRELRARAYRHKFNRPDFWITYRLGPLAPRKAVAQGASLATPVALSDPLDMPELGPQFIMIDIVEPQTRRVVWRGWSRTPLPADWYTHRRGVTSLEDVVRETLIEFPPR